MTFWIERLDDDGGGIHVREPVAISLVSCREITWMTRSGNDPRPKPDAHVSKRMLQEFRWLSEHRRRMASKVSRHPTDLC